MKALTNASLRCPWAIAISSRRRSWELTETLPKADPRRVARFLREVGEIGADPRGGWTRLAFGPEERVAHAIFEHWAADLGLKLSTDAIGNTFAEVSGNA